MKDLVRALLRCLSTGESAVVATVFSRTGSAPRDAGARMLFRADGSTVGSIGGGLLEAQTQETARRVHRERRGMLQEFDLTGEESSGMHMICGGRVEVWVAFVDAADLPSREVYREVLATLETHRRAWLLTAVTPDGEGHAASSLGLLRDDGTALGTLPPGIALRAGLGSPIGLFGEGVHGIEEAADLTAARHPALLAFGERRVLIEPVCSSGTAVIFGAGHISQQLEPLCRMVGLETVVVDDRQEYANRQRFPAADRVVVQPFDGACSGLALRPESYLIIVTRGHLHDQTVLAQALRTPAGYIGMIGSKKKRDTVFQTLAGRGFTAEDLARVHSPIGLKIDAETPEEIAVSIVAELIQCRASRR